MANKDYLIIKFGKNVKILKKRKAKLILIIFIALVLISLYFVYCYSGNHMKFIEGTNVLEYNHNTYIEYNFDYETSHDSVIISRKTNFYSPFKRIKYFADSKTNPTIIYQKTSSDTRIWIRSDINVGNLDACVSYVKDDNYNLVLLPAKVFKISDFIKDDSSSIKMYDVNTADNKYSIKSIIPWNNLPFYISIYYINNNYYFNISAYNYFTLYEASQVLLDYLELE